MKYIRPDKSRHKQQEKLAEQSFVELYPLPALIIEPTNQKIRYSNAAFNELAGYSEKMLEGQYLIAIFPGWKDDWPALLRTAPSGNYREKVNQQLLRGDRATINVTSQLVDSPITTDQKILFMSIGDDHEVPEHLQDPIKPWQTITEMFDCFKSDTISAALDIICDLSMSLANAEVIAVYLVSDDSPTIHLTNYSGTADWLPTTLSHEDIQHLQNSYLWKAGHRILSPIHRLARNAGKSYVASSPIGDPGSIIGVFVIASDGDFLSPGSTEISELSATIAHIVIQKFIREKNLKAKISELDHQVQSGKKIEQAIREGIITIDNDLLISGINRSAELIFGYEIGEALGKHAGKIVIGNDKFYQQMQDAHQEQNPVEIGTISLYRRSGEVFPAYVSILPNTNGLTNGLIILIADLSEQMLIQEQAQKYEDQAFLGELSAIFAHEVRNPINNLSTGLELLEIKLEDEQNRALASRLREDCDRLEVLMKSMLTFSKASDYKMVKIDLGHLINRLLEQFQAIAMRSGISIKFQKEDDLPPVRGNYRALEQVFTNLFENSIHAMNETGGQLAIKATQKIEATGRDFVHISVADTGPGIPEDEQKVIFQPFYSTKADGTGLGLAISKRIITAHKGSIQIDSFPGCSIFHLELPVFSD